MRVYSAAAAAATAAARAAAAAAAAAAATAPATAAAAAAATAWSWTQAGPGLKTFWIYACRFQMAKLRPVKQYTRLFKVDLEQKFWLEQ